MKKALRNLLLAGTIATTGLVSGLGLGYKMFKPTDTEIRIKSNSLEDSIQGLCLTISDEEWMEEMTLNTKRWFHGTGRLSDGRPVGRYGALTYLLDRHDETKIISPGFHSIVPLTRYSYLGRIGASCYVLRHDPNKNVDNISVIAKTEGAPNPPVHD